MKKIFTLALAAFASLSMWAEITTLPTSTSGLTNGVTKYEWSNASSQVAGNVLYWATRGSISADATVGMRPYQLGIAIQVTANVKLTFNVVSNTTSARTITGKVYTATDELFNVWKNTEVGSSLESYVLAVNKKDAGSMTEEEAAIHANEVLGAITSQKDANKKVLIGETAHDKIATAYGSAISHNCPTKKLEENSFDIDLVTGKYVIYLTSSGGSIGVKTIDIVASCEAPESALVLKASKTVDVVANDEITFSTEGGNGADVTIAGKNGETITANKWTAVKGEHIFTATQDVKDGKCGNTVELKLTVIGTDPVTEAKVTGSDKAKVGKEVTLTCEAEDATSFQWYKDGEKIEGANAETYKFTPTEAGEIIFACEAWNKNNDEAHPAVKSADFKVTVSEGDCGVLIKANLTGDKTTSIDPNSTVGGTAETNLGKAGKLNKECFFGVTLADGAFAEGDMFIMNITTAADLEGSLKLYEDKAGSNLIAEITEDINGSGEKKWKLPAAAAGKKSIYVVRGDVTDWNAYFTSIAIKRSCGDESKDASLKYLIVNGDTVKAESNVYNYMVAYASQDLKVTVKYETNDGGATSSEKKELEIDVPAAPGDTTSATFTITAEDEATTITYTINIIRPATDDSDATIKSLEINKTEVKEKDGVFAYEVPAAENLAKVVVEFVLNNPDARADKASGFEMDVPAAGAPAKETTINVVSKNGTKKAYKISVTKAEGGDEGLEGVNSEDIRVKKVMLNGQLFILKNGVLYNATGAVVK